MNRNPRYGVVRPLAVVAVGLLCASSVLAHELEETSGSPPGPRDFHELWRTWGWEPGSMICLALSAGLYALGLIRLWRASGTGHGIRRWEASCFAGGWVALFVALVSPLHPWGQMLFSAHMAQHEILMLLAAPLLVLGHPLIAFLHALPPRWASFLGHLSNRPFWKAAWGALTLPFVAWLLHAVVLWTWHAPGLFQATLHNEWIHAAQHTTFLLSALLFWWALIHGRPHAVGYGVAVLYLFTTAVHSGLLGALLTFARAPWYPAYTGRTESWGLSPLEDQQIGGLIMWVPACVVYIVAGLVLFAGWMRESERQVTKREGMLAGKARGEWGTVPRELT